MDAVHWLLGEGGWAFKDEFKDSLHGAHYLREIYLKANPRFDARVTVPVLWDKKTNTIGKIHHDHRR